MSQSELEPLAQRRCAVLMDKVANVYLTQKRFHWLSVLGRIKTEAQFKSISVQDLDGHWKCAIKSTETLLGHLKNCICDENAGERRMRANRLCIIDQAEIAAGASIEAARLQGRQEAMRFYVMIFVYDPSSKFHINAMIALREGDVALHDVWRGAVRLMEDEATAAKGRETLFQGCGFPKRKHTTANVPADIRAAVDNAPDSGKPFLLSDKYSRHAWAYDVHRLLYCRAFFRHCQPINAGNPTPRDLQLMEECRLAQESVEKRFFRANEAAELYCKAGLRFDAAREEMFIPLQPLVFRASHFARLAADARAASIVALSAEAPYQALHRSWQHMESVVTALDDWYSASLAAIDSMSFCELEKEKKLAALYAELEDAVRDVVASDLYDRPHQRDHSVWTKKFLADLEAQTKAVRESTRAVDEEQGRGAYYLQRMRSIDPALSPAHEKMRQCWEWAAVAVLGSAGDLAGPAAEAPKMGKPKVPVASQKSLWLAINYAHLADGLYADAAAYFLRAAQAAAAGDAEQEQCWRTAAEVLLGAAGSPLASLEKMARSPSKTPDMKSLSPVGSYDHAHVERTVQCAEVLAALRAAGIVDGEGDKLTRAVIRLTEHRQLIVEHVKTLKPMVKKDDIMTFMQGRISAAIREILEECANVAKCARRSGLIGPASVAPGVGVQELRGHMEAALVLSDNWMEEIEAAMSNVVCITGEDERVQKVGEQTLETLQDLVKMLRAGAQQAQEGTV